MRRLAGCTGLVDYAGLSRESAALDADLASPRSSGG